MVTSHQKKQDHCARPQAAGDRRLQRHQSEKTEFNRAMAISQTFLPAKGAKDAMKKVNYREGSTSIMTQVQKKISFLYSFTTFASLR
jgi:hypothetical protein